MRCVRPDGPAGFSSEIRALCTCLHLSLALPAQLELFPRRPSSCHTWLAWTYVKVARPGTGTPVPFVRVLTAFRASVPSNFSAVHFPRYVGSRARVQAVIFHSINCIDLGEGTILRREVSTVSTDSWRSRLGLAVGEPGWRKTNVTAQIASGCCSKPAPIRELMTT